MIGGNEQYPIDLFDSLRKPPQAGVYSFNGAYCGIQIAGVADHVCVGVVDNDEIKVAACRRLNEAIGQFTSRHLRREIVCSNFRRWHENSLLATKLPFVATVEEKCHMRIFFSLGNPQLPQSRCGDNITQSVGKNQRRKQSAHVPIEFA